MRNYLQDSVQYFSPGTTSQILMVMTVIEQYQQEDQNG